MMRSFLNKLLVDKSAGVHIEMFRYLFAGGAAFVSDLAVLVLFKEVMGVHYLVASVLGFMVGLVVSYLMSIVWVFSQRRTNNRWMEFLGFAVIGLVGLALTAFFMWLFTSLFSLFYVLSKLLTTVIVFVWNFTAKKLILFSSK